MASYKYLISGKESSYAEKHVDVVKFIHKAKFESKKEKMKHNQKQFNTTQTLTSTNKSKKQTNKRKTGNGKSENH